MIIDTHDYNVQLDINDDIKVIFKFIGDGDVHILSQALDEINIINDDSVILLWCASGRFYCNSQTLDLLNNFYQRIKNPVVLFSGSLSVETAALNFIHQPINLFQYISKIEQIYFKERDISITKPKKFLFTTTKHNYYRAFILQNLINNNFTDQGIISYKHLNSGDAYEVYFNDPQIINAYKDIINILPYGGLVNDGLSYLQKPEYAINDTYASIITETYFEDHVFISEKIYYAMLYNHFFIYAGPANTLKYLRTLGFKTFSHVIDETYDEIINPNERLHAVTNSMNKFLSLPLEDIQKIYADSVEIFNHNRQLVLQTEIKDLINSTLYRAINLRNNT